MKKIILFLIIFILNLLIPTSASANDTCASSMGLEVQISPNPLIANSDNNIVTITVKDPYSMLAPGSTYYIAFESFWNPVEFLLNSNDIVYQQETMSFTRNFPKGAALDFNISLRRKKGGPDAELCTLSDEDKLIIYYDDPSGGCRFETVSSPIDFNDNVTIVASNLDPNTQYYVGTYKGAFRSVNQMTVTSDNSGKIDVTLNPPNDITGKHSVEIKRISTGKACKTTIDVVENIDDDGDDDFVPPGTFDPTQLECKSGGSGPKAIRTAIGCIPTELGSFAQYIYNRAIPLAGGIALLLILFGAFTLITSAGNPEKTKLGQQIITSAITGLLFIIFAVFLLKLIGQDILNLPEFLTTPRGVRDPR